MQKFLRLGLLPLLFSASGAVAQSDHPDTLLVFNLPEYNLVEKRAWKNDTDRYHFNQTRYYVKTILPYVNEATKLFWELDRKINEPGLKKKERKKFIASKEDELKDRFEKNVSALNETQGVLLIKLIARQTGVNIYDMLQEFKNPVTALKWQAWSRLHGFSINRKYRAEDEALLEDVMRSLGYELPEFYHKD